MQDIIINPTSSAPQVLFETNGNLWLKGRSIILNVDQFYQPLCEWVMKLCIPSVRFSLKLDYFNSASSKKILDLLKIMDANNNIKNFDVFWYFEADDEDIFEIGQIFEEKLLRAKFYFKEYAEV